MPRWRTAIEWTAAVLLAALWFIAGGWKLSDLTATQVRMTQALVPHALSLAAAVLLGAAEVFAGVLVLVPAWRRWGAWLSGILLGAFMVYIGYHYRALTGAECSCFPWLKRAVGPMFFVQDAALIALAVAAGWWAPRPCGARRAAAALAAVAIVAGGLFVADRRAAASGSAGPASITVEGQDFSLRQGRVFLFFFNPACMHCFESAQNMSKLTWQATIVGIPTQDFDQGRDFFESSGVTGARLSPDLEKLRQAFPFVDVPYAVALENGQVREKLTFFEEPQFSATLRKSGFVR